MESEPRTTELLTEVRDLVRDELEELRAAHAKQAEAVGAILEGQAQALRAFRGFVAILLSLYAVGFVFALTQ